jgi:hypothetical protein
MPLDAFFSRHRIRQLLLQVVSAPRGGKARPKNLQNNVLGLKSAEILPSKFSHRFGQTILFLSYE